MDITIANLKKSGDWDKLINNKSKAIPGRCTNDGGTNDGVNPPSQIPPAAARNKHKSEGR